VNEPRGSRTLSVPSTPEWIGVAVLGVAAVLVGWSFETVLELPIPATVLTALAIALVLAALAGITWNQMLPVVDTPSRKKTQSILLVSTSIAICLAASVIAWGGWTAQNTYDVQIWSGFLNQLLQGNPDDARTAALRTDFSQASPAGIMRAVSATATPAQRSVAATVSPVLTPDGSAGSPDVAQKPATLGRQGKLDGAMVTAAAQALHLPPANLRGQLSNGTSLRQVAAAQQVPFASVRNAILAAVKPLLDTAVRQGVISSAQEALLLRSVTSPQFGTKPGLPRR